MPRKLKCFKNDLDLAAGLTQLATVEHEAESTIIRRALREYLQKTGAISTARIDARTGQTVVRKKGGSKKNS